MLKCSSFAAAGAATLGIAQPAESLTYSFNKSRFEGSPESVNDPSKTKQGDAWLTASFEKGDADSVMLTLQANLLPNSGAFISSVAFNLVNDLSIKTISCDSGCNGYKGFNIDYDKVNMSNNISGFDFELFFPRKNSDNSRLDGSSKIVFYIEGDGLTPQSFNAINEPSAQGLKGIEAAARLQGYDEGSSTIFYSAPGPLPILAGIAAFRASRRLRRRLASGQLASGQLASAQLASASPPAHRTV